MLFLLQDFLEVLNKDFDLEVFDNNFTQVQSKERLVLISYSAGVINLTRFARSYKENIEKTIMIAPAGIERSSIFSHSLRFFKEFIFFKARKSRVKRFILKEILANFNSDFFSSLKTLNTIRSFNLEREVGILRNSCFFSIDFILVENEGFLRVSQDKSLFWQEQLDNLIFERFTANHFGIIKKPDLYKNLLKSLI